MEISIFDTPVCALLLLCLYHQYAMQSTISQGSDEWCVLCSGCMALRFLGVPGGAMGCQSELGREWASRMVLGRLCSIWAFQVFLGGTRLQQRMGLIKKHQFRRW